MFFFSIQVKHVSDYLKKKYFIYLLKKCKRCFGWGLGTPFYNVLSGVFSLFYDVHVGPRHLLFGSICDSGKARRSLLLAIPETSGRRVCHGHMMTLSQWVSNCWPLLCYLNYWGSCGCVAPLPGDPLTVSLHSQQANNTSESFIRLGKS